MLKSLNKELIPLLKDGDMVAFDAIYKHYCKRLYGFVLRYIKIETDAEDIVQDVFVKIWEQRGSIDEYSSFESFIFTIAYNTTINLLRKRVTEQKYIDYVELRQQLDENSFTIHDLQYKQLSDKITLLLDKLSPRQKEVFMLSKEEGLSHKEVAKKMGISSNTVKKHLVHVMAFLREQLGGDLMATALFISLFF